MMILPVGLMVLGSTRLAESTFVNQTLSAQLAEQGSMSKDSPLQINMSSDQSESYPGV